MLPIVPQAASNAHAISTAIGFFKTVPSD